MIFVWLIAILVLVFVGLVILGFALCLWCRRKDKQQQKKNATDMSDKMKNQLKIVLPLPPPDGGDSEVSMDPTQHSSLETGKTEKSTEKSTLRESPDEVRSSKEQTTQAPMEYHKDESPNICGIQTPATDSNVLKKSAETESSMVSFTPVSVTAVISAPISAGATPRIARKIPAKPQQPQPPPPLVILPPPIVPATLPALTPAPPTNPTTSPLMNVPMGGVRTGSDMTDAIRSENLGSICDEDAGHTPLGTPLRSVTTANMRTGLQTPSTAGSSRLTTFTPASQSHGGSSSYGGRPV